MPMGDNSELVFAAQTGKGYGSPQRVETAYRFKLGNDHNVRVSGAVGKLGQIRSTGSDLGQFSGQATDEWHLNNGAILVLGFDYAKFVGAGSDASLSPRIGFQFDPNSKTRVRAAFTTQTTEHRTWDQIGGLEGDPNFTFSEPVSMPDLMVVAGKARMNKSRRLEFGVERVLDKASTVEANAFFDTTFSHGTSISFNGLDGTINDLVADDNGSSRGFRIVYQRRLGGPFTAAAGYTFGSGQVLSRAAEYDPANAFEGGFFQSFFAELSADLKSGTSVRTVFRLSPQATVFAIDPFKGRLAIYDPGLSVYVTQSLPTFGMPFRAQAVVDGRNLLDSVAGVSTDEGSIIFAGQRRTLRGGIQLRF